MFSISMPSMAPPFLLFMSDSHFLLKLVLYISLASFVLLSILKHARKSLSQVKSLLPPGPPGLPVVGNLHQVFKKPLHRSIHDLSKKYGDLMVLRFGSIPTLVISSADLAREIAKNHDVTFSGRAASHAIRKLTYGCSDVVFSSYGNYWREMRKISMVELLGLKRVQMFEAVRGDEVKKLVDAIAFSASLGPIDLSKLLPEVSVNIMARVAFGTKWNGTKINPSDMLRQMVNLNASFFLADFIPRLAWIDKLLGLNALCDKVFKELDELYDHIIEEHLKPDRSDSEHEDLIDGLLRLQKDPTQTVASNKNFVKAMIVDMLFAGTETTGTVLVWMMTEMIKCPQVINRATEEVRSCIKGKVRVEESDLHQLVYLKAIVKETLRLHPPAPVSIPRETVEPCELRGYQIPEKMRVLINLTSISLDPGSWENPEIFHPERFLDTQIDFKGQHFEFVPFGIGRRICPGINFATVIIELVTANLLYCFDWELPHGVTADTMDVEDTFGIAAPKKTPLYLSAIPVNV